MKTTGIEVPPTETGILEGLNPAQASAILHGEGPLLIVAGAGTGKTTVLTRRIAHLVASKKAAPREILALTFTDKAAQEMEERVDRLVPYGFNDVWISTFHSFGDRIIRENAFDLGMSPDVKVLSQPEAVVFMKENLFKFELNHYRPLSDPTRFIEALLTAFSRAKDEEVSPADFIASAQGKLSAAQNSEEQEEAEKEMEVARAYEMYEKMKFERGFVDFGDQVLLTLKILREQPSVLKKIHAQFKYILVDEFQDTNYAQFELLKMLAQSRRNITVVGDDDQSIYKFRGACLSNILGFRKAYPEAVQIVLQENYRSTQVILDAAYRLIQHNNPDRLEYQDRINKYLRGQNMNGPAVAYHKFDKEFSEREFIASSIQDLLKTSQVQAKNIALLVRTNAAAEPFIKTLNAAGIPWKFSGNSGLYEQEEIKIVLSFLRAVDDEGDSSSLYYLAASRIYDMSSEDLSRLTQAAKKMNRSLLDLFKGYETLAPDLVLGEETIKKVAEICENISRYRSLSAKIPTGVLLYQFLDEKGVFKNLAETQDWRAAQEAQNLQHFFEMIKRFAQVSPYDRLHEFVRSLEALRTAGENPASADLSHEENAVSVLTVHSAKGLEFDTVFIAGCEQDRFPARNRSDKIEIPENLIKDVLPEGNYHTQEERRLFYVAMTRAKRELILTSARDLGGKKSWKSSQFVLEALDKPNVDEKVIKSSPLDSLRIFTSDMNAPERAPAKRNSRDINISATAIEDYLSCPLKFKFSRVLRIPVLMHHTTIFGIAVHEALKSYHIARRDQKDFTLKQLLDIFTSSWKSEGFVSREHEERRLDEGLQVLKTYFKSEEKSKSLPSLVEEDFRMGLGGATLRGRWDRIDLGDETNIIDYKTGDVKDQKAADAKARDSKQLGLYALAYEKRFGKLPDKLSLHFVKFGIEGTVRPTPQWIEKTLQQTEEAVRGITEEKFDPSPGFDCRWCAYEKICPALRKG